MINSVSHRGDIFFGFRWAAYGRKNNDKEDELKGFQYAPALSEVRIMSIDRISKIKVKPHF